MRGAIDGDAAGIGGVNAGDDLDQRAFAGAVFAAERPNFARGYRQRDVAQDDIGAEALGDVRDIKQSRRHTPEPSLCAVQ